MLGVRITAVLCCKHSAVLSHCTSEFQMCYTALVKMLLWIIVLPMFRFTAAFGMKMFSYPEALYCQHAGLHLLKMFS